MFIKAQYFSQVCNSARLQRQVSYHYHYQNLTSPTIQFSNLMHKRSAESKTCVFEFKRDQRGGLKKLTAFSVVIHSLISLHDIKFPTKFSKITQNCISECSSLLAYRWLPAGSIMDQRGELHDGA